MSKYSTMNMIFIKIVSHILFMTQGSSISIVVFQALGNPGPLYVMSGEVYCVVLSVSGSSSFD